MMKDLAGLMKQAQDMQRKMGEAQEKLETLEVTGEAGAGIVKITLTAKGELVGVEIDRSLSGPDDIEVIEDLVKAAHADAKRKADDAHKEVMGEVTSGLQLPPGIDMPFGMKP